MNGLGSPGKVGEKTQLRLTTRDLQIPPETLTGDTYCPQEAKPQELPRVFSKQEKPSQKPHHLTETTNRPTPLNRMIYNRHDPDRGREDAGGRLFRYGPLRSGLTGPQHEPPPNQHKTLSVELVAIVSEMESNKITNEARNGKEKDKQKDGISHHLPKAKCWRNKLKDLGDGQDKLTFQGKRSERISFHFFLFFINIFLKLMQAKPLVNIRDGLVSQQSP